MAITPAEIAETRGMVEEQNLDIRTITMGVSLMGCGDENLDRMCTKIYDHVTHTAEHLVETAENLEREYGIPIVNKRVSVTPVAQIAACCKDEDLTPIAHALDRAAETLGIDYLGGFSALVQKGIGDADRRVIQSIPQALATTSRVCSSVNVASLRAGINMDAVLMAAQTIIDAAKLTADQDSVGASKFVCFANMVEDSPFMAGAVHGGGEADAVINVGVSGPGVMAAALETLPDSASMMEVAEKIKQTAFKITRAGELMSREAAHRLGVEKGIVDLSLAPTPAIGDSVARILEIIGVGTCGGPGTTCALAMLNDAVKKGGDRQALHEKIRQYSMEAGKHVKEEGLENDLCDMILADPMFMITAEELNAILQPENFTGRSAQQTEEFVAECIQPILDANKELLGEHYEMKN